MLIFSAVSAVFLGNIIIRKGQIIIIYGLISHTSAAAAADDEQAGSDDKNSAGERSAAVWSTEKIGFTFSATAAIISRSDT